MTSVYSETPEGTRQRERDTLICYLMAIKEEKQCMAVWVSVAEDVCRAEWRAAFDRLMLHTTGQRTQEGRETK